METRLSEVLTRSANYIPSGRQLLRTPPMSSVKRHLDFENANLESVMPNSNAEDVGVLGCENLKMENPYSMLKGMKGYLLTPADLNFLKKKAEDEHIKKLQGELAEAQALLKKEENALTLALASREMIMVTVNKFPSLEDLSEWVHLVLCEALPIAITDWDTKSVLAKVTMENIQRFTDNKNKAVAEMKESAAKRHKKEVEEKAHLEIQVASEELKIQELMRHLTDLKSDLFEQETKKGKKLSKSANQSKAIKSEETEEIKFKPRLKGANKERNMKLGLSVTELSKHKSGAEMVQPVKLKKETRGRKKSTDQLEFQQPLPGLRRSKRIANRN